MRFNLSSILFLKWVVSRVLIHIVIGNGSTKNDQSGMGAQTQGFSNQGGPTPGWQSQRQKEIGQDVLITLDGAQLQIKKPIGWQLPVAS